MANWIQSKRKMTGLSQQDVVESLGISRQTYIKLEKAINKPSEGQKAILSRIFDISQDAVEDGLAVKPYLASDRIDIRKEIRRMKIGVESNVT